MYLLHEWIVEIETLAYKQNYREKEQQCVHNWFFPWWKIKGKGRRYNWERRMWQKSRNCMCCRIL